MAKSREFMREKYHPGEIESEAQRHWHTTAAFKADEAPAKQKYYCLSMFPYPSGKLAMTSQNVINRVIRSAFMSFSIR